MEIDVNLKLKELKEFEGLQQATHYRLCESILEMAEQVDKRLKNIEKKLNHIIISEMDSEDGA
jgi:predicted transcriptional regulator